MKNYREKIFLLGAIAILIAIFLRQDFYNSKISRAIFCDVGQGDGTFINLAGGIQIAIDGGPDNKFIGCVGKHMPYFDHKIELMIISHPDKDHFEGAIKLLENYQVEKIITSGDISSSPDYQAFLSLAGEKIQEIGAGEDMKIGNSEIDFLSPEKDYGDENKNSLIFKLSYGGKRILFTGDAPTDIEENLIKEGVDLKAEVLKIAHHGSDGSLSKKFYEAVHPELAIISVSKDNKYGHPSARVLKALQNLKIKYSRTDEIGDVTIDL